MTLPTFMRGLALSTRWAAPEVPVWRGGNRTDQDAAGLPHPDMVADMATETPPPSSPEAPYDTGERYPQWEAAVSAWPWTGSATDGWRKSGACPRCGHTMVVLASGGILARGVRTITRRVLARCACAGEHADHPERSNRDWGCGFSCRVPPPP